MASPAKEVARAVLPFIREYNDGSVERLIDWPYVPPSSDGDAKTGVSTKDVNISQDPPISARVYLPIGVQSKEKLPILVYFHGGGFCIGSAFSTLHHAYLNILVSHAKVVAASVEYRLAPEHPLPAAYEDCWTALQWVASHCSADDGPSNDKENWLREHGDFKRVFIGGDSAGANIVHNMAIRAGAESLQGGVNIRGAFASHPYFWGSQCPKTLPYQVWDFVYPDAPGGIDNPMINPDPAGAGAPSLASLGCSKLLVCVADKDELWEKGVWYYNKVKESGWGGEAKLLQVEGEEHCFDVLDPDRESSLNMIKRLAAFLNE